MTVVGSRVTGLVVGDEVAALIPPDGPSGGFAQSCAVSSAWAVRRPVEADAVTVAGCIRGGLQAYTALFYLAHMIPGDTVCSPCCDRGGRV